MYRYGGDGSEEDLVRFMIDEYREVHGEDVPPPPSMLSDLREKLLDFMDEHWTPVCFQLIHGLLTVTFLVVAAMNGIDTVKLSLAGQQEEGFLCRRDSAPRVALGNPARGLASAEVKPTHGSKDAKRLSYSTDSGVR